VTSGVEDEFALSEVPEFVEVGRRILCGRTTQIGSGRAHGYRVAGVAAPAEESGELGFGARQTRLGTKERLAVGAAKNPE